MKPSVDFRGDAAAWSGRDFADPSRFIHVLGAQERRELEDVLRLLSSRAPELSAIEKHDYPLPRVCEVSAVWREELKRGRGFLLLRGVPVEGAPRDDLSRLFYLLGLHLGTPKPQNLAGELLTDVRDTGADPSLPSTRLYTTRAEQDFHTDGADIIGLLCLRKSKSGGESRIVSSVRVFEEVRRRRPDLAPLLFEPWYFRLTESSYFPLPICRWNGKSLSTFYIGWYIRHAQGLDGVPQLSAAQHELLEVFEATANDPAFYLDMTFEPGDVQWLKNAVVLHKRTAYEDWPEPDRKRHLLRLWLAAPDFEDGDALLRGGIGSDHAD